jgi:hypothetical protein
VFVPSLSMTSSYYIPQNYLSHSHRPSIHISLDLSGK